MVAHIGVVQLVNLVQVVTQLFQAFSVGVFQVHIDQDRLETLVGGAESLVGDDVSTFAILHLKQRQTFLGVETYLELSIGIVATFYQAIKEALLDGQTAVVAVEVEPTLGKGVFNVVHDLLLNADFVVAKILVHEFPEFLASLLHHFPRCLRLSASKAGHRAVDVGTQHVTARILSRQVIEGRRRVPFGHEELGSMIHRVLGLLLRYGIASATVFVGTKVG